MTPDERERLAAAETERHDLLVQAARNHLDNVEVEARRYRTEILDIERTYRLRTGQEA